MSDSITQKLAAFRFCKGCPYNCPCDADMHIDYCTIEHCNHDPTFRVAAFQTCEVWKAGTMVALEENRPIPLLKAPYDGPLNPLSPYGPHYRVMLHGGVQVLRRMDGVRETHPDGTEYIWYNPYYLLQASAEGNRQELFGSSLQLSPDGSFKARIEAREYKWGPPILRSIDPDRPSIELHDEIIDFSRAPHPASCSCGCCRRSSVKPVYYHKKECPCGICAYGGKPYDCVACCNCYMCVSEDEWEKDCLECAAEEPCEDDACPRGGRRVRTTSEE